MFLFGFPFPLKTFLNIALICRVVGTDVRLCVHAIFEVDNIWSSIGLSMELCVYSGILSAFVELISNFIYHHFSTIEKLHHVAIS